MFKLHLFSYDLDKSAAIAEAEAFCSRHPNSKSIELEELSAFLSTDAPIGPVIDIVMANPNAFLSTGLLDNKQVAFSTIDDLDTKALARSEALDTFAALDSMEGHAFDIAVAAGRLAKTADMAVLREVGYKDGSGLVGLGLLPERDVWSLNSAGRYLALKKVNLLPMPITAEFEIGAVASFDLNDNPGFGIGEGPSTSDAVKDPDVKPNYEKLLAACRAQNCFPVSNTVSYHDTIENDYQVSLSVKVIGLEENLVVLASAHNDAAEPAFTCTDEHITNQLPGMDM